MQAERNALQWKATRLYLKAASEGVRPKPARGEKNTDEEAMEAVRLGAEGVSSTSGACTDVVTRTGASGFCTSPSMPNTCRVVSSSCKAECGTLNRRSACRKEACLEGLHASNISHACC